MEDYENEQDERQLNEDDINKLLEEAEEQGNDMNEENLLTILKNLEGKISLNNNLRLKFAGEVEKFIDSESDLHEEIKVLQRIAAYPKLINVFVLNRGVELLMSLLVHENIDIVSDAVIVYILF